MHRLLFSSAALGDPNPESAGDDFPSGAQWSPDASCIATAQDGCVLLYDTPASALGGAASAAHTSPGLLRPALTLGDPGSGESLYSFCFFSCFDARSRQSDDDGDATAAHPCCLATSSRGQPVRLWDCLTGAVRAVYGASSAAAPEGGSAADALASPLAVAFSPDGAALAAGYPRGDLVLFDVSRPGGRDAEAAAVCCRPLKKRRGGGGGGGRARARGGRGGGGGGGGGGSNGSYAPDIRLAGPIGCVAFAPAGFFGGGGCGPAHVLAAGSYGGGVGVFDVRVAARRRLPPGGGAGGGGAAADAAADDADLALASNLLPTEFGRRRPTNPRITADASAAGAGAGASSSSSSLAPVLEIDCGGRGGGGGVTQLLFAAAGSPQPLLFCGYRGARLCDRIDGWDVRALREPVVSIETGRAAAGPALSLRRRDDDDDGEPGCRTATTRRRRPGSLPMPVPGRHQRIQFDVKQGVLVTGSGLPDGRARAWGLAAGAGAAMTDDPPPPPSLLASLVVARGATVNAVAVCPGDPCLLAVASGQRGYPLAPSSSEEEDGASGGEGEQGQQEEEHSEDQLPRAALALWRWSSA